jgi:hypothetical protein
VTDFNACYVTTLFGQEYNGMLLTLLHALETRGGNRDCYVFCQDNGPDFHYIQTAFPHTTFVTTHHAFASDPILRISSKTLLWGDAMSWLCRHRAGRYDYAAFLDADTLAVQDPFPSLQQQGCLDAEVVLTVKDDEVWPLNTGVLFARVSDAAGQFFQCWKNKTFQLFEDPAAITAASSIAEPYGGIDQMAMYLLLDYDRGRDRFSPSAECGAAGSWIRKVPCARYNQTQSAPIAQDTCIIHYKGGWQPILLEGRNFTAQRPRRACLPMYRLYLDTYRSAVRQLSDRTGCRFADSDWGISVPRYVTADTPAAAAVLYAAHYIGNRFGNLRRLAGKTCRRLCGGAGRMPEVRREAS